MILLKLSFSKTENERKYDIVDGELLKDAVNRALVDVPLGKFKGDQVFNVVVNGHLIEKDLWDFTKLIESDNILITPRILEGDQTFKQVVILAAIVIAQQYELGPFITMGVAIGATLLMNALIPPPVPNVGPSGLLGEDIDNSQMYAIEGQSNQMRRLGIVPKVYGVHRVFPMLAVTPYTELSVSPGEYAEIRIENIIYRAINKGTAANGIKITYQSGGTAGNETVVVTDRTVVVTYDGGASTANQIIAKLQANAAAMALFVVTAYNSGDTQQTFIGDNFLGGGEEGGETVQYLYAIYDFGLGVMDISDVKIGDTPLTSDSFKNFEVRYVDPLRPAIDEDIYDTRLQNDFSNYKSKRILTGLSISLLDGNESIQFSDENTDNDPQEIVLDLICPRGLYGFSSNGAIGSRNVKLEIHFALVGTTDWRAYNDINFVDAYETVGGTEVVEFEVPFATDGPPDPATSIYYTQGWDSRTSGTFGNRGTNTSGSMVITPGTNKLYVLDDPRFEVGAKVFWQSTVYLGTIQAITNLPGGNTELTMDQVITNSWAIRAYEFKYHTSNTGVIGDISEFTNIQKLRTSRHESGAAVINGGRTSAVYASFRFTPKIAGQYQVRVKRVNAFGDYDTQTADDVTWVGLSTCYKIRPINTTKRHLFLELKIKGTNQLNGQVQNLSAIISSVLPIYDADSETWTRGQTSNPAWVYCDLLTGEVNKKAVSVSRLHLPSIVEWAEYCDEIPTPPPDAEYFDPRFQCNFILDYDTTLQGVINQVTGAAQASLNIVDGKYGVLVDKFKNTPVQVFTPRNSRDFSSTRLYGPRPHGLKIKFIDPNLNWEVSEAIAYDNGYNEDNATDLEEMTSFGCTSQEQAWRFGRYMIAQNKLRQETISILVDFENLVCTRGDYVQLAQDVMKVGGRPARVKAVEVLGVFGSNVQTYTEITIDDALDQVPAISYGYVFRPTNGGAIYTGGLEFDEGFPSIQTIVFANWPPTGGAIKFRWRGNTTVSIPYTDMLTSAFIFAIRDLPETDFTFWLLETMGDFNGTFKVRYDGVFDHGDELEIVDNTLTYGGGDIDYSTSYEVGTTPSARKFILDDDSDPSFVPSVGDLIVIGEIGNIVFDCIVKTITPNDDLSATLTLIEKADEIFDFESSDVLPEYDPQISTTSNSEFGAPGAVEELTLVDNTWECAPTRSGYNYYIHFTWKIPLGSVYEHFEIWVNDGRGYHSFATVTSMSYKYNVDQERLGNQFGFKVVAVAASGKKLQLVAMPEILATPVVKSDPPSNVSDFSMSITNQILQLSWSAIDDCDAFQYVLRYSPDSNDVWESSIPLVTVSKNVTSVSVQARTGVYFIKAIDFAGNESDDPAVAITTIPNLFDLNIIEEINEAPDFLGTRDLIELLGEAVILQEEIPGDINSVKYYSVGYYEFAELLDLGDIYSVRLQSLIRADGLKKGELMSEWVHLTDIDHLNTAIHSDWNAALQYRATESFASMSDWEELQLVDHINLGAGVGFTDWRDIPTTGDATGRIFQFRTRLESFAANVTPRVFDTTVKADMPDRTDTFENQISSASDVTAIVYDPVFKGPGTSPNIQISIDDGESGDYWTFDYKTLEGFGIRFYDSSNTQVVRQFDVAVKGYGRRHTATL